MSEAFPQMVEEYEPVDLAMGAEPGDPHISTHTASSSKVRLWRSCGLMGSHWLLFLMTVPLHFFPVSRTQLLHDVCAFKFIYALMGSSCDIRDPRSMLIHYARSSNSHHSPEMVQKSERS
jgi:hypothetical protein